MWYSIYRKEKEVKIMKRTIYFDMDGTIANLYAVLNWLPMIRAEETTPYTLAVPMVKMNVLARLLNNLKRKGWTIGIVSWTAKNGTEEYNERVAKAKMEWLKVHLKSVEFDEVVIVPYGTPKSEVVNNPNGILFDDEEPNRTNWKGTAFDVNNIIEVLKGIA